MDESEDEDASKIRKKKVRFDDDPENPLITDLDHRDKKTKRIHKAELWFEKDIFKNLEDEKDEDLELDKMVEEYKKKGGRIIGDNSTESDKENKTLENSDDNDDDQGDSDSDYDVEEMMAKDKKNTQNGINSKNSSATSEYTILYIQGVTAFT